VIFPSVPNAEQAARFRLREASPWQKAHDKRMKHGVVFDVGKGAMYSAPKKADGLPKMFRWEPGTYHLRRVVLDHFSTWCVPLPEPVAVPDPLPPLEVEGFQASPKKVRREVNLDGKASASAVNLLDV
jgi:hypothetical protein